MPAANRLAVAVFLLAAGGTARAWDAPHGLPFVPNLGQSHPEVAFNARTSSGPLFVTGAGDLVHLVRGPDGAWALTESFVGGKAVPRGGAPAESRVSYFVRSIIDGRSLPTYETLHFSQVWEGIDLSLAWKGGSVEKVFTVAPGVSASAIRIRVRGAEKLRLEHDGSLVAATGIGNVSFRRPVAYQIDGAFRVAVDVEYALFGSEYGFRLGEHDPALPLIIDPILQSTYLGGNGFDGSVHIAIDPASGDVYVTGTTHSANFPGVAGGAQPALAGGNDAFVARLNSSLTSLLQATFFGGSNNEFPTSIDLSPADGSVYVAGYTESTVLPGTAGAAQPVQAGGGDAFVVRFSSSLTTLHRATFLGGSFTDRAFALRIRPSGGEVYVAGDASSVDFPARVGGAQPANNGSTDAFLSRLDASLGTIFQSTYLGGGSADEAHDVAFAVGGGEVFITGITQGGLPGTAGGADPLFGGAPPDTDAFVARFNPSLTSLAQATYLGGIAFDNGYVITVDPGSGDVFVAGSSASLDFPGVSGGAQTAPSGGSADAFLSRLSPSLTILRQSTFFGGSGHLDNALGVRVHPSGAVYATGPTDSSDLPGTAGGAQPSYGGFSSDAYVARFDPTLRVLQQATYLGGSRFDFTEDMEIGFAGEIYVAGTTDSFDFPGTAGGAQATYAGIAGSGIPDAFVARLSPGLEGGPGSPIPTLSPGAMAILATLLVAGALALLRLRG